MWCHKKAVTASDVVLLLFLKKHVHFFLNYVKIYNRGDS
ncbi:hypothetical protein KN10_2103 [Anoxybacillus flavithermus NBRC 109594]|uniref:Uncharacterized protein n=1 Tax=Anoxybacillus flavithermus NBRC 109594 TaxID=1315967 RepID=R4G6X0_9BACL|nr:hypothetical protein KN10_2103 [Anoxybacillus flavithermus NBRC 109594]